MSKVDDYIQWLKTECGYVAVQGISGDSRWVAVQRKMFTWAIVKGTTFNRNGIDDVWCYPSFAEAVTSMARWMDADFKGEPQGWSRHPGTGRRVAGPEGAIDENGQRIEPGQRYVNR
jgi:hypothetical protein